MRPEIKFGIAGITGLASVVLFEVAMANGMRTADTELKQNPHYIRAQGLDDFSKKLNYAQTRLTEKSAKGTIADVLVKLGDEGTIDDKLKVVYQSLPDTNMRTDFANQREEITKIKKDISKLRETELRNLKDI